MGYGRRLHEIMIKDVRFPDEPKRIFVLIRYLYLLLGGYYLLSFLLEQSTLRAAWYLVYLLFPCILAGSFYATYRLRSALNVALCFLQICAWIVLFIIRCGWDCGVQHLIFPLIGLYFFTTSSKLIHKILISFLLFFLRLALFLYMQSHLPQIVLGSQRILMLQVINSMVTFTMLGLVCGFYSSSIASAEKKLILYNARLQAQASRDPMTGLLNRRSMQNMMDAQIQQQETFSIALGDIDFFKRINDRWGHNMGDEVLLRLSQLFQEEMEHTGSVCRWGGEEFLFFFPTHNGDTACQLIGDILMKIRTLEFQSGDERFHVTMTFGVEEYDFASTQIELIRKVDEKLYMGKESGRNQIVY